MDKSLNRLASKIGVEIDTPVWTDECHSYGLRHGWHGRGHGHGSRGHGHMW